MLDVVKKHIDRRLRLPQLRGFTDKDFDSPSHARIQQEIFEQKPVLQFLYREYARLFIRSASAVPPAGRMVEVGSGPNILKKFVPNIITSDVARLDGVDLVFSASKLPFKDASLDRLFFMYVFHHVSDAEGLLNEAYRCLKNNGEMVIIDPAINAFSKFYYSYMHVDMLDVHAEKWGFSGGGRLSASNIALLWIVLERDKELFHRKFPRFQVEETEYVNCISFLLSGGFRLRQLAPAWFIKGLFRCERWFMKRVSRSIAVSMSVVIRKKANGASHDE